MLRFVLGLLYFFRLHFVFLFVKSYVGWEACALVSHLHVFCFQSKGGVKYLRTGGEGVKNLRTVAVGRVTNLERGWYFCWGGSTPLHGTYFCLYLLTIHITFLAFSIQYCITVFAVIRFLVLFHSHITFWIWPLSVVIFKFVQHRMLVKYYW